MQVRGKVQTTWGRILKKKNKKIKKKKKNQNKTKNMKVNDRLPPVFAPYGGALLVEEMLRCI
jgi:hypothetical protein